MIPFLVVDRPISLRIIKGSGYENLSIKIGLMSHANTSSNFQILFKEYPCQTDFKNCELNTKNNKCEYPNDLCRIGKLLKEKTIKIVDSGVFTKDGCKISEYRDLFNTYDNMGADFGIIKDCLNNKRRTLVTAKEAMNLYKKGNYNFNLYGVAQGKKKRQYVKCFNNLTKFGYQYIAIGGLLKKINNTLRYTKVKNQTEMFEIIELIKSKFKGKQMPQIDYIFALGCYHPKRHNKFENIGVYGSDFKGWIFQYKNNFEYLSLKEKQEHRIKQVRHNLNEKIYSKININLD